MAIIAPSKNEATLLGVKRSYIAGEVRAKELRITTGEMKIHHPYYTKRWQINGATYEFGLCETSKLTSKIPEKRARSTTEPR